MREIGGYIELDTYHGAMLHDGGIALNCGRSALAYICEARGIKKLYVPDYNCNSVTDLLDRIGVSYKRYTVGADLLPIPDDVPIDSWLYVVNYYGQLNNGVLERIREQHPHMIVDNVQAYFQMPMDGVDTLYTCRKFFGVADGAFLYTDARLDQELPQDESHERMRFLLGRYERSASEFYSLYSANNAVFSTEPIKRMSQLTQNLLHGLDYERIAESRRDNFQYLHDELGGINELKLTVPYGAFMYPLLIKNGAAVRPILQEGKIYIPTLWPNVIKDCTGDTIAYRLASDILPLPVDQRYDIEDMKYMVDAIYNVIDILLIDYSNR